MSPGRAHMIRGERDTRGDATFGSKAEARYYDELCLRVKAKEVVMFTRQTRLDLPGGVRYAVDFVVYEASGRIRWIDVKGRGAPRTREYLIKKRLVEALYPIKIEEVER
jgi:hypothetical protein